MREFPSRFSDSPTPSFSPFFECYRASRVYNTPQSVCCSVLKRICPPRRDVTQHGTCHPMCLSFQLFFSVPMEALVPSGFQRLLLHGFLLTPARSTGSFCCPLSTVSPFLDEPLDGLTEPPQGNPLVPWRRVPSPNPIDFSTELYPFHRFASPRRSKVRLPPFFVNFKVDRSYPSPLTTRIPPGSFAQRCFRRCVINPPFFFSPYLRPLPPLNFSL